MDIFATFRTGSLYRHEFLPCRHESAVELFSVFSAKCAPHSSFRHGKIIDQIGCSSYRRTIPLPVAAGLYQKMTTFPDANSNTRTCPLFSPFPSFSRTPVTTVVPSLDGLFHAHVGFRCVQNFREGWTLTITKINKSLLPSVRSLVQTTFGFSWSLTDSSHLSF